MTRVNHRGVRFHVILVLDEVPVGDRTCTWLTAVDYDEGATYWDVQDFIETLELLENTGQLPHSLTPIVAPRVGEELYPPLARLLFDLLEEEIRAEVTEKDIRKALQQA